MIDKEGKIIVASKRGNDAIPSWSGFNYQGKVMLLYVLQKMNSIIGKVEFSKYSVELENREDFVIKYNGKSESFHQVKATLSNSKLNSYTSALDKLLQHRNSSDNSSALCYFMVANEIDDWNNQSNAYISKVTFYKYCGNIVALDEVKNYITKELVTFMKSTNNELCDKNVVYGELCMFLDDRVAMMHKQSYRKRNYNICFSDFYNVILQAANNEKAREEYYHNEKIYNFSIKELKKSLENICSNKCKNSLQKCSTACAAKKAYQKILNLPDIYQYCKIINPSKNYGWENKLKLTSEMANEKMEKDIFYLFFNSNTPDKVDSNKNTVFLYSKFCNSINGYIIPTLLDLSNGVRFGETSLQNTFKSIKNNVDILDALDGNAITAIPGDYNGYLSQAEITAGWNEIDNRNIGKFYHGIEIISTKELLDKFKKLGGNHD